VDVDVLCRRLGHDPGALKPLRPSAAWELQDDDGQWLEIVSFVGVGAGRVLLVEEDGYQGSDPRVLRRLSSPTGLAVSAY
jgi:hypothetical protein